MPDNCPHTEAGACGFCYQNLKSSVFKLEEELDSRENAEIMRNLRSGKNIGENVSKLIYQRDKHLRRYKEILRQIRSALGGYGRVKEILRRHENRLKRDGL